LIIDV
jgi:dynein heavy chain